MEQMIMTALIMEHRRRMNRAQVGHLVGAENRLNNLRELLRNLFNELEI